jgi:hypothetical protein
MWSVVLPAVSVEVGPGAARTVGRLVIPENYCCPGCHTETALAVQENSVRQR